MTAKALLRTPTRLAGISAASLLLLGCIGPPGEAAKAEADFQHFRSEQQERDNYQACLDLGVLPGSPEILACQLELAKKDQQPTNAQKAKP
jgi:hypothetical protein